MNCFVDRTLSFLQRSANAGIASFLWIDDTQFGFSNYVSLGLPHEFMVDYRGGIGKYDPLSVPRTMGLNHPVISLGSDNAKRGSLRYDEYVRFLAGYSIIDEVDMVFFACNKPIAFVSLMRKTGEQALPDSTDFWNNIHSYVQEAFRLDKTFQSLFLDQRLQFRYGLSERERDVIKLILNGSSNSEIGGILGIKLSTVKSHVINILDKLGVGSRLGIMALCQKIMLHDT